MSPVVRTAEVPPRPLPGRPFPEVPVVPPPPLPPPPPPLATHHLAIPQVRIPQNWEYKHITRGSRAPTLADEELNALGREGWEMVGVVAIGRTIHFYFKREGR